MDGWVEARLGSCRGNGSPRVVCIHKLLLALIGIIV